MTRPFARMLLAGAVLATAAACANPAMDDAPREPYPPERPNETQPGAKPPVPRRNPKAVPYQITLRIENAPGPLNVVTAGVSYDVLDDRCLPRRGTMSGVRLQVTQSVPLTLTRIGPDTYRTVVHDDLFLPDDYYGLGVCKWALITVGFRAVATGAAGKTRYTEAIFREDLIKAAPIRVFFLPTRYPRAAAFADYPEFGEADPTKFRPEYRARLFSFAFDIERLEP